MTVQPASTLDMPFAARKNPLLGECLTAHLDWMRGYSLLDGEDAEREYLNWDAPALGAYWWPSAAAPDLLLGLDLYGWIFAFEGQFDGQLGYQPQRTLEAVDQLTSVLCEPAPGPGDESPAVLGFRDLWLRISQGMPDYWKQRARVNWANYFAAVVAEVGHRAVGQVPSEDSYLKIRDTSGLMYLLLDATERIGHCQIPRPVFESAEFQALHQATVWACNLCEDLHSWRKEEVQADPHNLVFVLERERGYQRHEAIDAIQKIVGDHAKSFLRAEASIPDALDRLRVPVPARPAVYMMIDYMRANFSATHEWCRASARYSSPATTRDTQPGYLGDILTVSPGGNGDSSDGYGRKAVRK